MNTGRLEDNGSTHMVVASPPRPTAELFDRVRDLVRRRTTEYPPATMRVPLARYRDTDVAAEEEAKIFKVTPLVVALSAALPNPGDYVVRDMVGRSLIVSRGEDRRARVFANACRHRGSRLAEGTGCARRFVCPYHGWSYDTTGAVVGLPGRKGFDDVDIATIGLAELPSEESHGFVWCSLEPGSTVDLPGHLGAFAPELAAFAYASYYALPAMEVPVTANWKCVLEAFYETYHFPFVHPNSPVGMGTIANTVSFDAFGHHARLGVPLASMRDLPPDATSADGEYVAVLYYIYPNVVVANSPIGCEVIEGWPSDAPNRSVLRHTFLSRTAPHDSAEADGFFTGYLEIIRAVVRDEDGPVLDRSGMGIASAVHAEVILGRNEPGCQHIHRQIAGATGADR